MSVRSPYVLLLAGSVEQPSRIRALLDVLELSLRDLGVATYLWDLAYDPLPIFDPRYHAHPDRHPCEAVRTFVALAEQAQAFIWGSPVYHNSFSGVLKNALDMLSEHQVWNKPVALVSCGSNDRTGSQPCDQLQSVARSFHTIAIPRQIVTLSSDFVRISERYHLKGDQLHERAALLAKDLVSYTEAFQNLQRTTPHPLFQKGALTGTSDSVRMPQ